MTHHQDDEAFRTMIERLDLEDEDLTATEAALRAIGRSPAEPAWVEATVAAVLRSETAALASEPPNTQRIWHRRQFVRNLAAGFLGCLVLLTTAQQLNLLWSGKTTTDPMSLALAYNLLADPAQPEHHRKAAVTTSFRAFRVAVETVSALRQDPDAAVSEAAQAGLLVLRNALEHQTGTAVPAVDNYLSAREAALDTTAASSTRLNGLSTLIANGCSAMLALHAAAGWSQENQAAMQRMLNKARRLLPQ